MPDVKEVQAQDSTRKYGPKATLAQVSVPFVKTKVLNKKCLIPLSKYVKVFGYNSAEFSVHWIGHEPIDICDSHSRLVSKSK